MPILGVVDDLVLIPLGIAVAVRMIPPHVLAECRAKAHDSRIGGKTASRLAAAVIVAIWLVVTVALAVWAYEALATSTVAKPS